MANSDEENDDSELWREQNQSSNQTAVCSDQSDGACNMECVLPAAGDVMVINCWCRWFGDRAIGCGWPRHVAGGGWNYL